MLRLLARPATGSVAAAVQRTRPVAIVSLHPLTGCVAVQARDRVAAGTPVLGVVTDLVQRHGCGTTRGWTGWCCLLLRSTRTATCRRSSWLG